MDSIIDDTDSKSKLSLDKIYRNVTSKQVTLEKEISSIEELNNEVYGNTFSKQKFDTKNSKVEILEYVYIYK